MIFIVTGDHFAQALTTISALQNPVQQTAVWTRNDSQSQVSISVTANENGTVRDGAVQSVPRRGAEQSQDFAGNLQVEAQDDALYDARRILCHVDDARLDWLIGVWPKLGDDVKAEILVLAGLRPNVVDNLNDVQAGEVRLDGFEGL